MFPHVNNKDNDPVIKLNNDEIQEIGDLEEFKKINEKKSILL